LPDKPSIAVLPFQNMSGDPEQEYFADGLAQEAEAHAQLALRLSPRGYGIGAARRRGRARLDGAILLSKPSARAILAPVMAMQGTLAFAIPCAPRWAVFLSAVICLVETAIEMAQVGICRNLSRDRASAGGGRLDLSSQAPIRVDHT
jgi:hypothetical protein